MSKDYYGILGIDKNASQEDIKKAFRKLSLQHHPDRNQGNKESEEKFKEINEAYSVLSDPQKRAQHDNPMFGTDFTGFGGFPGFQDGFNFGFNMRPNKPDPNMPMRGHDLKYSIGVPLSKLIFGGNEVFNVSYDDVCLVCNGTGAKQTKICSSCNGSGVVIEQKRMNGMHMMSQHHCPACRGRGHVTVDECEACNGSGKIQIDRTIEIEIPENTRDGHVIRKLGGGGKGVNGGPSGDLLVRLSMKIPKSSDFNEEQKGTIINLFA